jgi:F420-0:gamma-glutamyl ligase-like protein
MARLRIVLAATLAVSALAVLAIPASASVPATNTRFCKAAAKIGDSSSNASVLDSSRAKKVLAQFKTTAKYAPPKVKSAIGNISKLLGAIAGTTDPTDLAKVYTSSSFKNYPAAITTFFTYQASECGS